MCIRDRYDMDKHVNLNVTTKITSPTIKDFVNKAQMFIDDTALYQVSAKTSINKGFLEKGKMCIRDSYSTALFVE